MAKKIVGMAASIGAHRRLGAVYQFVAAAALARVGISRRHRGEEGAAPSFAEEMSKIKKRRKAARNSIFRLHLLLYIPIIKMRGKFLRHRRTHALVGAW